MGRPSSRRTRRRKDHQPFLEKGLGALFVGAGLWLLPLLMAGDPLLRNLGHSLRPLAWFLIGAGVLLLGIHYVLKDKAGDEARRPLPKVDPILGGAASAKPSDQQEGSAIWRSGTSEARSTINTSPQLTQWSPSVFQVIEWRRFEAVCELLFAQAGFEARTQSHGPDGGVDVWLYSKHAQGPALVVQCKHWRSKRVGVKEMREFLGVMASNQLKRGTYATTSTFTSDAVEFAKRNGIHLLDGNGLIALIAQRTPEQQQALLAVAFEGDYARPTCASCGIKMVKRTPSTGGSNFWGCSNYPRCRSRLGMIAG
jgi:restriction system protein